MSTAKKGQRCVSIDCTFVRRAFSGRISVLIVFKGMDAW